MTARPPRICHIATVDLSVGILLKNQLLYFKERGMEVHAMSAPGPYVEEVEAAGIPFHPAPMTRTIAPGADLAALRIMVDTLRRERFDLIHVHTPKGVLLGTLAGVLAGVPTIFRTIHGFYFNANASLSAQLFFVNMERVLARAHHTVFSQNSEDIATARDKGIRPKREIIYLGNGIDLTRFSPEAADLARTEALRRQYGIEPGDTVLGFVGRQVIQKGLRELFAAFARLAPSRPDLKLLMVGDVDEGKSDAVLPADHLPPELQRRVILTGWQKQVEAFYPLMDIFVLPSYREGFPRTAMEASAHGLPVVATDIRGCREAVAHDVNGLMVPSREVDGLTEALSTLIDDPRRRAALGQGGRRKAAAEFNERDKFATIYREYARLFGLPDAP